MGFGNEMKLINIKILRNRTNLLKSTHCFGVVELGLMHLKIAATAVAQNLICQVEGLPGTRPRLACIKGLSVDIVVVFFLQFLDVVT